MKLMIFVNDTQTSALAHWIARSPEYSYVETGNRCHRLWRRHPAWIWWEAAATTAPISTGVKRDGCFIEAQVWRVPHSHKTKSSQSHHRQRLLHRLIDQQTPLLCVIKRRKNKQMEKIKTENLVHVCVFIWWRRFNGRIIDSSADLQWYETESGHRTLGWVHFNFAHWEPALSNFQNPLHLRQLIHCLSPNWSLPRPTQPNVVTSLLSNFVRTRYASTASEHFNSLVRGSLVVCRYHSINCCWRHHDMFRALSLFLFSGPILTLTLPGDILRIQCVKSCAINVIEWTQRRSPIRFILSVRWPKVFVALKLSIKSNDCGNYSSLRRAARGIPADLSGSPSILFVRLVMWLNGWNRWSISDVHLWNKNGYRYRYADDSSPSLPRSLCLTILALSRAHSARVQFCRRLVVDRLHDLTQLVAWTESTFLFYLHIEKTSGSSGGDYISKL